MTEVTLREATPADAAACLGIIRAAFAARPAVDPPAAALTETLESVRTALERGTGVLGLVDGEPAGVILVSRRGSDAGLHRVSVLPGRQRLGLASAMVDAALELAADLGARRAVLTARREFPELIHWWARRGFEVAMEDGQVATLVRALPKLIVVPTAPDMQRLGRHLAGLLRAGDLVLATGDLGAGKTCLTQGIGAGLGVTGPVISPTFVLSRVHASAGDGPGLVHVDAYRLGSVAEVEDLDLEESMDSSVTVIEWGRGVAEPLSRSRLEIDIRRSGDPEDETRRVYLAGIGPRWRGVEESLEDWRG